MRLYLFIAVFGLLSAPGTFAESAGDCSSLSVLRRLLGSPTGGPRQPQGELIRQGRLLVRIQEEQLRRLYPTSGYPDEASLLTAIEAFGPQSAETLNRLRNEQVEAAIRAPVEVRELILKQGFLNQRSTQTSAGTLSPESRDHMEAFALSLPKGEYETWSKDLKPKYGYLSPRPEDSLYRPPSEVGHYGSDIYILNLDRIRDRMTWTLGDSATSLGPMSHQSPPSPNAWDFTFVPWRYRNLMVPAILPRETRPSPLAPFWMDFSQSGSLSVYKRHAPNNSYIELQFWGPVTLDDVKAIEFESTPPTDAFRIELEKRGIQIRKPRGRRGW